MGVGEGSAEDLLGNLQRYSELLVELSDVEICNIAIDQLLERGHQLLLQLQIVLLIVVLSCPDVYFLHTDVLERKVFDCDGDQYRLFGACLFA